MMFVGVRSEVLFLCAPPEIFLHFILLILPALRILMGFLLSRPTQDEGKSAISNWAKH